MHTMQGIQIKIHPTDEQQVILNQLFGNDRFVLNQMLNMILERYKNNHTLLLPSTYDLQLLLKPFKQEYAFLKFSDSSSSQVVCANLIQSWQMFFKHPKISGKPHFHSRHSTSKSYVGKSTVKILANHYLKLPKLGILKCNGLNQIQNDDIIKRYQVMQRPNGQYYVSLQVQRERQPLPKTHKAVWIDLGLHDLVITSDHQKFHNLNFKFLEAKVKHYQRRYSRRLNQAEVMIAQYNHNHPKEDDIDVFTKSNWQASRILKSTYQRKIKNIRHDILSKITTELVQTYDVIVIENLQSKNMMKNHKLANAISNHAWYTFRQMLMYKCDWYGKQLIIVVPKNTSRICHACRQKNHAFDHLTQNQWLAVRSWTCPNCQIHVDRDVNAAQNILYRGLQQM